MCECESGEGDDCEGVKLRVSVRVITVRVMSVRVLN